jgi:hypothetical protein
MNGLNLTELSGFGDLSPVAPAGGFTTSGLPSLMGLSPLPGLPSFGDVPQPGGDFAQPVGLPPFPASPQPGGGFAQPAGLPLFDTSLQTGGGFGNIGGLPPFPASPQTGGGGLGQPGGLPPFPASPPIGGDGFGNLGGPPPFGASPQTGGFGDPGELPPFDTSLPLGGGGFGQPGGLPPFPASPQLGGWWFWSAWRYDDGRFTILTREEAHSERWQIAEVLMNGIPGTKKTRNLIVFPLVLYNQTQVNVPTVIQPVKYANSLASWISQHGYHQLRVSETYKKPHITTFFSGGILQPVFRGEDRIVDFASVSENVADKFPLMNASRVTESVIHGIKQNKYKLIVCNFANVDATCHPGNVTAVRIAAEFLDTQLAQIHEFGKCGGVDLNGPWNGYSAGNGVFNSQTSQELRNNSAGFPAWVLPNCFRNSRNGHSATASHQLLLLFFFFKIIIILRIILRIILINIIISQFKSSMR